MKPPNRPCMRCGTVHWSHETCPADAKAAKVTKAPRVIEGAKFVAAVGAGTKLLTVGNTVFAAGPNQPASIVTDDGLKPIKPKKPGRPREDGPSKGKSKRADYQKKLMRKKLDAKKVPE